VPPGIETDGRTVFTSDEAVSLEWLPRWLAIIGSGYIGLEFADVYTALGCEVTMIEALDRVMPTFDPDIAKIAARNLIDGRDIDARSGVLASKMTPGCPVKIELVDMARPRSRWRPWRWMRCWWPPAGCRAARTSTWPAWGWRPTAASSPSTTPAGAGERGTGAAPVGRG
jgi:hypothetical protein